MPPVIRSSSTSIQAGRPWDALFERFADLFSGSRSCFDAFVASQAILVHGSTRINVWSQDDLLHTRVARILGGVEAGTRPLWEVLPRSRISLCPARPTVFCNNTTIILESSTSLDVATTVPTSSCLCASCLAVADIPALIPACGHIVCSACAREATTRVPAPQPGALTDRYVTLCPCCNVPADTLLFQDELRATIEKNFTFSCPMMSAGCTYKGVLADIESHIATCRHVVDARLQDPGWLDERFEDINGDIVDLQTDLSAFTVAQMDIQQELRQTLRAIVLGVERLEKSLERDTGDRQSSSLVSFHVGENVSLLDIAQLIASRIERLATMPPHLTAEDRYVNSLRASLDKQVRFVDEVDIEYSDVNQMIPSDQHDSRIDELVERTRTLEKQLEEAKRKCMCGSLRVSNDILGAENVQLQEELKSAQEAHAELQACQARCATLMEKTNTLTHALHQMREHSEEQNRIIQDMAVQLEELYADKPVCGKCRAHLTRLGPRALEKGESIPVPSLDTLQVTASISSEDINVDITAITLLRYLFHPKSLPATNKLEQFANECKHALRRGLMVEGAALDERYTQLAGLLERLRQFYASTLPLDQALAFLNRFQFESSLIMREQFGVEARKALMEGYRRLRSENQDLRARLARATERKSVYEAVLDRRRSSMA
ncbi:RING-type zinc-finger domain-containing protein [Giardia muris]|uniref:RING-type zinc-finger domain-containing protein n=1 Tax=Giardia muris TaxID=5742 RepID=A0A4Z1SS52_GIAMU|nr:RING-type zinc-finger domain-containing protein [Giardia muris]|eukprot:TNJ28726.1 RING-type zinc-finger domain-containing protein [Giardia muris]